MGSLGRATTERTGLVPGHRFPGRATTQPNQDRFLKISSLAGTTQRSKTGFGECMPLAGPSGATGHNDKMRVTVDLNCFVNKSRGLSWQTNIHNDIGITLPETLTNDTPTFQDNRVSPFDQPLTKFVRI